MFRVVNFHGPSIDVRLKCVIIVGQGRECVCHGWCLCLGYDRGQSSTALENNGSRCESQSDGYVPALSPPGSSAANQASDIS